MRIRLLLVEDHLDLQQLLSQHLQRLGYQVLTADNYVQAHYVLAYESIHIVVLDLGLPDQDGLTLLRTNLNLPPCIVLTARDAIEDRIIGLDAGADDYLIKPVDVNELDARLRAVLRRHQAYVLPIKVGNIHFESQHLYLTIDGVAIELGKREAQLLEMLLMASPRVVVKHHIEAELYTEQPEMNTPNAVEALVSRLRKKLKDAHATVSIDTVRGIGYRLQPHDSVLHA